MVAMVNKKVEYGIDSNIIDSRYDEWLDLESNYNLNAEGVFDNNKYPAAFVCMAYIDDPQNWLLKWPTGVQKFDQKSRIDYINLINYCT